MLLALLKTGLAAQELVEYRSEDGKYAVRFPAKPSRADSGPLRMVAWHSVDGSYTVSSAAAKPLPEGKDATLARMADAAARAMHCDVKERRPVRLGDHPGMELTGPIVKQFKKQEGAPRETGPPVQARLRIYLTDDAVLQVLAQGTEAFVASPRTAQVLGSLRLVP